MLGFNERVNLIYLGLAKVLVGKGQLRQAGKEAKNAKHPQSPNHQLIKVTLRVPIHL